MTRDTILANATLVLPNETLRGQVRVVDGRIATSPRGPRCRQGPRIAAATFCCRV